MSNEIPISSTFIFVDRRKTGRGKSLPNREKLLKRIKDSIRAAKPEDIDSGGVKGGAGAPSKQLANPVKVARDALAEPTFRYARRTGEIEVVLPGNDKWLKGDEFPTDEDGDGEGRGEGGSGPGEDGEDDFVVNISRREFYDVFFEDCELPDLEQTAQRENPEAVRKPAGFQKDGNPGQLSVIRSYRNSIGRRRALTLDDREELQELQDELDALMHSFELEIDPWLDRPGPWAAEVKRVSDRMAELRARIAAIPLFEKVDHRYRKTERVMVKMADAVLGMAMDISGSMDEKRKRIARKFFSLQYAFIKRKYPNTDLFFIYHTDEAEEVQEEEFFTSQKNGGTVISPAIVLAHKIIRDRYDPTQTNIYFSYAGDGDNFESDNTKVRAEIIGGLLPNVRHSVYIQVGDEFGGGWGGEGGQAVFWKMMQSTASEHKKLHNVKAKSEEDIFQAFKSVYGKKPKRIG